MSDVTLSYKGSDILELSDSGSATLKTGGTYCEADIELEYVKPSGGLDFIDVDEGEITVTSSGLTALTINHSLGVVPFCCMVWPKSIESYSGKHVFGGISFFVSKNSIAVPKGVSFRNRSNLAHDVKEGLYSEDGYTSPDEELPSPGSSSNYVKNITATSFQLTSSSSYPIGVGTYRWRALAFNSNL